MPAPRSSSSITCADAGAFLHHDQRLGAQLVERDRAAGEAVARRARRARPRRGRAARRRPPRCRRAAPTTPSSSSRSRDALDDASACRKPRARPARRGGAAGTRRAGPGRPFPRAGRGAELERAARARASLLARAPRAAAPRAQHALRAAVEREPGLGRLDAAARAVEQLAAEPLLERPDLEADRRLRHPEPLGRLREALPLDDGAERRELPRVHKRYIINPTRLRSRQRSSIRAGGRYTPQAERLVHPRLSTAPRAPTRRRRRSSCARSTSCSPASSCSSARR